MSQNSELFRTKVMCGLWLDVRFGFWWLRGRRCNRTLQSPGSQSALPPLSPGQILSLNVVVANSGKMFSFSELFGVSNCGSRIGDLPFLPSGCG